jgi:carbonic anhydrase/acetyltransferase-like protein (isoleucine patch superfamily)
VPLLAIEDNVPTVSATAWIAPTATLVGDVCVEDEPSIWYGAVLRADFGPTIIRRGANVQDGCIVHGGTAGVPARVTGRVTASAREWVETNPAVYRELARRHAAGVRPA